ncbi:Matrix metalloproteinase-2 [Trichinella spiralis]|uniref:Matrix metalloproteinase-2 n=1 Tax=Trichinella spiralis TaxID=6334 RepID=A0ABR3KNP8_TRISP
MEEVYLERDEHRLSIYFCVPGLVAGCNWVSRSPARPPVVPRRSNTDRKLASHLSPIHSQCHHHHHHHYYTLLSVHLHVASRQKLTIFGPSQWQDTLPSCGHAGKDCLDNDETVIDFFCSMLILLTTLIRQKVSRYR